MWAWTCPIWASPGWGCSACSWRGEVLVTGPLCGSRWAAQWCELLPWTKRNFEWMTSHCDRSNWILKTHLAFLRIQWDSTGHISEYYIFNFPSQERSKKKVALSLILFTSMLSLISLRGDDSWSLDSVITLKCCLWVLWVLMLSWIFCGWCWVAEIFHNSDHTLQ